MSGRVEPAKALASQFRGGPTALRIMVGAQLRRLRESRGLSAEDAGYAIRASQSKISRMESGRVGFKARDVADLLTLYGVRDEDERDAILSLARQSNMPGWWHQYGDIIPGWFEAYLGLEGSASFIRIYETQLIPDLLQTEAYARTVIGLQRPMASQAEVESRVGMRMGRQRMFDQSDPPRLWAVFDEAALHRFLGHRALIREQLRHLLDVLDRPNVTLQIVPIGSPLGVLSRNPFSILRFPPPELPDIVYIEQLTNALYIDKGEDVAAYRQLLDKISMSALSVKDSTILLHRLLTELDG
ncbi:Helix-turn-helix domain-containing protein [Thermomonospora echinospora]|uniref:Helix-turn-helix domain-containing protein n=1 Tax=Thermomonospora echinospora TaxID=1992 RepID=A0A1H5XU62_9ACTN|nr:helix-turn-helix transcriptional regulator [Thermomonospora echinospora]SEG15193.1 Helix-turn-helix domain-containing protein [Thermomonospora echinospora]